MAPARVVPNQRVSTLPARLRLVVTRLARRLRQESEPSVSPTQLALLATIERAGALTLGELADVERVRPPTVTAAIGRLEDEGLVRRQRDDDDGRVTRVSVTPAGRQMLERTRSRKTAYLERRLASLSAADRAALERAADVLERILQEER